jgi:hypothetical protein
MQAEQSDLEAGEAVDHQTASKLVEDISAKVKDKLIILNT